MFTTKLPGDVRKRLEAYAEDHGVTMMDVLCRAIVAYTSRPRTRVEPWPREFVRSGKE